MAEHQIMAIVGNGFDISVLKKYGKGVDTSYPCFYDFYRQRNFYNQDNELIIRMSEALEEGKTNWSDFEERLNEALTHISSNDDERVSKLKSNLEEIQFAFSRFLNETVNNDIIDKLSNVCF